MLEKNLNILGMKVTDKVTGFKGVATSVSFDLYGCIQVLVNPGLKADGSNGDCLWLDIDRLNITSTKRVMDCKHIARNNGPEKKPVF